MFKNNAICPPKVKPLNQYEANHLRINQSSYKVIGASRRETLSLEFANNKGADQPADPRSLISAFVIRLLISIISKLLSSEISIS